MTYLNSLRTKKDFVEQISKAMPTIEAYKESLIIIERMISISQRIAQLEYSIVQVGAFLSLLNVDGAKIPDESYIKHGIYLNYMFVETTILLELEKRKEKSNSPHKVFDLTKKYLEKYYVNGAFIIANGVISFNPDYFMAALESYYTAINQEQEKLKKINNIRNKYAAHFDLDFSIENYDFEVIMRAFIVLENAWINLLKSMGVVIDSNYMNFDEYKNSQEKMKNRINDKVQLFMNQEVKGE